MFFIEMSKKFKHKQSNTFKFKMLI